MTDGQRIVCRRIARAEARSAECRLDDGTCIHQICKQTLPVKVCVYRKRRRIYGKIELIVAAALSLKSVCCFHYIGIVTACAAGNDPLLYLELTIRCNLIQQCEMCSAFRNLLCGKLGFT